MSRSKDGNRDNRPPRDKRAGSGGSGSPRKGRGRNPDRNNTSNRDGDQSSRRRDGRGRPGQPGSKGSRGPRDGKPSPSRKPGRSRGPKRPPRGGSRNPTIDTGPSSAARLSVGELAHALVTELERRLRRHPSGDLVGMRRELVPLVLELPVTPGAERLRAAQESLEGALRSAVDGLVAGRAAESVGKAYCLRCASFGCDHGAPQPRQVFVGFAANGTPRFEEYSQALLARGDEGMEDLYGASGQLVTRMWTEEELMADVLPTFVPGGGASEPAPRASHENSDTPSQSVRLLAQVTAGWYWVPQLEDPSAPRNFALSFQVLAIESLDDASRKASRRLVLSAVGASPLGGPLEDLQDELGDLPWGEATRWLRTALSDVEAQDRRAATGRGRDAGGDPWEERVLRIVAGFARRLTRRERAERRRTKHAEDRRKQKRPTGHALADLDRADDDRVLRDTQRSTFVVLGDRGRTHIFNPQGRLVTSIQYTPEAIERRRRSGRWQSAEREHVQALRAAVAETTG